MSVGDRIKNIRMNLGMTQDEFGQIFGTSKHSVSNWETGKNLPSKSSLLQIAEYSDLSVEELLNGKRSTALEVDENEEINMEINELIKMSELINQNENYFLINILFSEKVKKELQQVVTKAFIEGNGEYYVNEVVQPFLDQMAKEFKIYTKYIIDNVEDNKHPIHVLLKPFFDEKVKEFKEYIKNYID